MKYDVDYFIAKFSAIPKNKWTTKKYSDGNGAHCALGHCGATEETLVNTEVSALTQIIFDAFKYYVSEINDFENSLAAGKHPRTRILNALKYIKNKKKNKSGAIF